MPVTNSTKPVLKSTDYNHPNRFSVAVFQNENFFSLAIQKHYLHKESGEYKLAGGFSVSKQDALSLANLLVNTYQAVVDVEETPTTSSRKEDQ